jgi:ABC-2 type transport system ATP-binding protein
MRQIEREMRQSGDFLSMLQVRRLEKVIENHTVLSIDALDINAGEVVAIIGQVNSGKSLLVRLLSGVLPPGGGSIMLDGQHISTPAVRKSVGVLFEEDLLYERLSAQGNLEFYCQMHHIPKSRMSEVLALVGLSDQAHKPVTKLSPSTQRRLAFARVLVSKPSLLLLDQPIIRTDMDTQMLFARLITQAASDGAAVLLTDEDLSWAGKCCTRVVELEDGRIVNTRAIEADQGQKQEPLAPERLTPFKVPARKDDRILLYDPGDILFATSRDGKTYLRTATEEATTNLTLQELETRLTGRGFFKAHRAYLVNLQHIKAVIQFTRNSYTLQLNDKQETMIPLSKQSEKELQGLLGY